MSTPSPGDVLRHRGPALLVGTIDRIEADSLACTSNGADPWRWPQVLEGAAQTAGLLAGLRPGGLSNRAIIAEYGGIRIHTREHAGPIHFLARLERRLLHFWRCRVEARAADGTLLLEGAVTLAPGLER